MTQSSRPQDRSEFEIAVICAVELESDAVEASFDEVWEAQDGFGKAPGDHNTYTTGRIGPFNVVLAYMPGMGKVESANVTAGSLQSFPNIKLGLVVGVCGAVPMPKGRDEIILGDVIISTGVEQFDFGRKFNTGIRMKDTLDEKLGRSTREIRAFLKKLRGYRGGKRLKEDTAKYLDRLCEIPEFESHCYPGTEADTLFPPGILHKHTSGTCSCVEEKDAICDEAKESSCSELDCHKHEPVERNRLPKTESDQAPRNPLPMIHFGTIASGDQVIRDAHFRDDFAEYKRVIAFEMEGAGAWDNFPTVVIKGVCDYADSHKNKKWQPHAAATAAACMKAFLSQWISSSSRMLKAAPTPTSEPEVKLEVEEPVDKPSLERDLDPLLKPPPEVQPGSASMPESEVESDSDENELNQGDFLRPTQNAPPLEVWRAFRMFLRQTTLTAIVVAVLAFVVLALLPEGNIRLDRSSMPATQEVNSDYPIFAIIGRTGVGKSSFIKVLGGRNESNDSPEVCHGLDTCTNDVRLYKTTVGDSPVYLVDTPGFDDTRMSDKEVMEMIYNKLEDLYRGDKLVKGMIYLHDITQPRVGGLAARQFRAFEQLLGVDRFKNLVFVTTKWLERPSEVDSHRELEREAELQLKYWKKMIDRGSQVMRHDGSPNSAKLIIMSLIYKPTIKLLLSPEEVQQTLNSLYNEPLVETDVNENDDDGSEVDKVADVRQISVLRKLLWTTTRVAFVAMAVLMAGAFIGEKKWLMFEFTWECLFGNFAVCVAIAGLAGLVRRWHLLSAAIFPLDVGLLLLCVGIYIDWSNKNVVPVGVYVILAIGTFWLLPMTYLYWESWPHTSDMYFF